MLKRITAVLMTGLLVSSVALASDGTSKKALKSKLTIDAESTAPKSSLLSKQKGRTTMGAAVQITTLPNQLSTGTNQASNYFYDAASGALAFGHRGPNPPASGAVSYNWSTDGGNTWSSDTGPLNTSATIAYGARYPNLVLINPTASTNPGNLTVLMAYPYTGSPVFGYATDPFGQGTGGLTGVFNNTSYDFAQTTTTLAVDDKTGTVFTTADDLTNDIWLQVSTNAGVSWTPYMLLDSTKTVHPSASASVANTIVATDYIAGKFHVGYFATFPSDSNNFALGWTTSTNNGATFSSIKTARIKDIADLSTKVQVFNYANFGGGVGQIQGGFVADANGTPHFFVQFVDTLRAAGSSNNTGIYEVYNNGSSWQYSLITKINRAQALTYSDTTGYGIIEYPNTSVTFGNFAGMGDLQATRTADGKTIGAKWVDVSTSALSDTLTNIYVSARSLKGSWLTPVNITNTPTVAEQQTHVAKRLNRTGSTVTFYVNWTKVGAESATQSNVPVFAVSGSITDASLGTPVEANHSAATFALKQNYPNPFNPSTSISYSLAQASKVTLKVYDVLGREVATLVNDTKSAGDYTVRFNADNLASGVYLYKVQAGAFSETRKMILVK